MAIQARGKKFFSRAVLATGAWLGIAAFTGTPGALADNDGRCQRRIAKADHKLHEAAEHHGWNERHRWWDEDGHRWHTDRDWDDHDHDRH
jgi:hypothetical protein